MMQSRVQKSKNVEYKMKWFSLLNPNPKPSTNKAQHKPFSSYTLIPCLPTKRNLLFNFQSMSSHLNQKNPFRHPGKQRKYSFETQYNSWPLKINQNDGLLHPKD